MRELMAPGSVTLSIEPFLKPAARIHAEERGREIRHSGEVLTEAAKLMTEDEQF